MSVMDWYSRKSSEEAGRSVAAQESAGRRDAAGEGYTIGRVFADDGISASGYAKKAREDFPALVAHIRAGACQIVGMWECSRGSRKLSEWSAFLELCEEHSVLIRVVNHKRTYDPRNGRDWKTLANEGVEAQSGSKLISDNTREGKRQAAEDGLPAGRIPYGYTRTYDERGKLIAQVEHPEHGPIVREIAARMREEWTGEAIARDLNGRDIPAPGGGQWRGARLPGLILSKTYLGQRVHQGETIGDAIWPAILDAADVKAIADRLEDPRRLTHRGTELRWPLAGLLPCRCGGRHGTAKANRHRVYRCDACHRSAINGEHLDRLVVGGLLGWLAGMTPEQKADVFAPPSDDAATLAAQNRLAKAELAKRELDAAAKQWDGPAPDVLAIRGRAIDVEIAAATSELASLAKPAPFASLAEVDIPAIWNAWSVRKRRDVIAYLVEFAPVRAAKRGYPRFDPWRMADTRWRGDTKTWGEHWTADGLA